MNKRAYIQENKDWLIAKSKEEGVKALPKGIYYKVLSGGDLSSAQPTARSIVTAHYTGWTINGKQFDSSRGGVPLAYRLSDLIEGWIIAMQHTEQSLESCFPVFLWLFKGNRLLLHKIVAKSVIFYIKRHYLVCF